MHWLSQKLPIVLLTKKKKYSTGVKLACQSIVITIEIVIDFFYLGPVAIRSYLLASPYWKDKHSWCHELKWPLLGCSSSAMCLVLSPMMDGENLLQHVPPAFEWVEIGFFFCFSQKQNKPHCISSLSYKKNGYFL